MAKPPKKTTEVDAIAPVGGIVNTRKRKIAVPGVGVVGEVSEKKEEGKPPLASSEYLTEKCKGALGSAGADEVNEEGKVIEVGTKAENSSSWHPRRKEWARKRCEDPAEVQKEGTRVTLDGVGGGALRTELKASGARIQRRAEAQIKEPKGGQGKHSEVPPKDAGRGGRTGTLETPQSGGEGENLLDGAKLAEQGAEGGSRTVNGQERAETHGRDDGANCIIVELRRQKGQ
jgi:hypothetical protein